ncbi:MAG: transcriptional regulator [Ruegeria sp.]|uniref:helix-turn-helix domain-containing protein n=1 Tax=Ruegeria sp. TaxID=1879320 RepID=UPI00349EE563
MSVDLHRHEFLKCQLRCAGSSLTDIARRLGVSQSTVTVVCQGYRKSHRIQTAVAECLGTTPQHLFPDRYPAKEENMT